ncbi:putative ABC transporter permease protein [Gordonia hirsuta DSM 44140 = NBRC 16056]|uniref:Putative ABC transporter permease protein n=1 Tax=Gordonia hirsuta DSM 44140 = NBRC 16056 TaxID=1121927 RepID=L7LG00_9ACTN|nr:iron ABC transporter permease [Gordonia hirsuta]GAC59002.1 putative ABC transporter permease protein [Gordonia hirsuta DSM 44140 = NBRC 16056]
MKKAFGALALGVLLAALCLASLAVGSGLGVHDLSYTTVFEALTDRAAVDPELVKLVDNRLVRTGLGLSAGLALGAAGALTQGHTRNPLADPGLLGINAGAAFAVVTVVFIVGATSPLIGAVAALGGAAVAALAVFALANLSGGTPITLVLAGTGLSAFGMAITSAIVLSDGAALNVWRTWNVGALAGRGPEVLWATLPFIAVGLVLALAGGWFLNLLSLGDEMATALGGRLLLIRLTGIATIALLAGAATAACGPIVFLGLVVPHLARAVVGPDYRWIVPYSALIGAVLLLACDVLGRVLARPGEIPVGVMLALVGGPALMLMVRRRRLPAV